MAKYMLYNPDTLTTNSPLFPGNCQYKKIIKIFHKVIKDNVDSFQPPRAHYIRKGAITIVATGFTVSPPMASIFLRDGWSMGPIKDQYIHYKKVGDKFVVRSVTGIYLLNKYFGIPPVHRDWTYYSSNLKDKTETSIKENLVIRKDVSGPTFIKKKPACICFQYEHLDTHLHTNHRLRASPIYIASVREKYLHKYAVIRYPWLITNYTPYAT